MLKKYTFLLCGIFLFCCQLNAQERYKRDLTITCFGLTGAEFKEHFTIDGEILFVAHYPEKYAKSYSLLEIKDSVLHLYSIYQINDSVAGISHINVALKEFLLAIDHPSSYVVSAGEQSYDLSLTSDHGDVFDNSWYLSMENGRYKYEGNNGQVIKLSFSSEQEWLHVVDEAQKAAAKK